MKAPNRLDAAINHLEQHLKDPIEQHVRRLREAIELQRRRGRLTEVDEAYIAADLELIETRDRAQRHSTPHLRATEEIDYLIQRIMNLGHDNPTQP